MNNKEVCAEGTRWSAVMAYNGTVLLVMAANFVLMTFGAFFFYPRVIGTLCNCCCACFCHFGAWTMALAYRYNPIGVYCSINVAPNHYLGDG